MALQILNAGPPPEDVAEQIRAAIAGKLPESAIDVRPQGPGHFEITVTDVAFDGLNRVKQQHFGIGKQHGRNSCSVARTRKTNCRPRFG